MPAPALAQEPASSNQEIIVTARKREETLLTVPVVATVLTGDTLTKLNNPQDVQALVPSLRIGDAVLSSGTRIFLRGVGTTSGDPGVDQSVSLNVDGLQLTNGLAYKSGLFDLGRIEVLKGPQGLFYGKNSPGGVVSLYSADPTDRTEVIVSGGYETEARTWQGDVVVSGPVADTLKLRLAARYSDSDGYFKNPATALAGTGGLTPNTDRLPGSRSWIVRGTAIWNPTSEFEARLKANYVNDRLVWGGSQQYYSCPDGTAPPTGRLPYLGGGEDCKFDRTFLLVGIDPAAFPGAPSLGVAPLGNNGIPTRTTEQVFGTLTLNYTPSSQATITSVTGYYHLRTDGFLQSGNTTFAGPSFVSQQAFRRRDFTEELRLNTSFSGPLNFTIGGFYQDAVLSNLSTQRGNILQGLPAIRGLGNHRVPIKTYSVFGQLRWQVTPQLELTGGVRWSDEKREDTAYNLITGTPVPVTLAVPRIHTDNTKPEFTATYRPTDTLTLFASYKTGYKSGSLNIATGATNGQNNSYGNEDVKGWEAGVKSRLFDHQLALDIAGYDYRYTGLQVTTLVPGANLLPIARTLNAGRAQTYGIELDAAFRPAAVAGLDVHASINWNHARFNELKNVPCWGGQTIAEGCNQLLNPTTNFFTAQDLSGIPLLNAPEWAGSFGFDYELPVGNGMKLAFSNNNYFSSKYLTTLGRRPDFYQQGWFKFDMGLTLKGKDDRWEVAVLGRNLSGEITAATCANGNLAGGFLFGGQVTGGTTRGPAGVDEVICYPDPGREIWLTIKLRPFG
jgi:iron complex outermembrane receptor protein